MKIVFPNYNNSINNLMSSIRKHYGLNCYHNTIPKLDDILLKEYRNIIIILFDGLGSNVISKTIGNDCFMSKNKLLDFITVYPCTTAAAITSYLSCKTPLEHCWLGWHMYFKDVDKDIVLFNNKGYYDDTFVNDFNVFDILNYKSILDELSEIGISTYSIKPPFNLEEEKDFKSQINKVRSILNENDNKKFIYIYNNEPDHLMHEYGVQSLESVKAVRYINDELEKVYKEIDDETLILVCADHGMTDVIEINLDKYPKLLSMLKRLPSIEPRASSFYVKNNMKNMFEEEFNKLFGNDFLLLSKEEAYNKNIFGLGNPHKFVDDFIGDYIALATGKYMFVYDNENKRTPMKAAHAGLLEDEMLIPLIIIKKNAIKLGLLLLYR